MIRVLYRTWLPLVCTPVVLALTGCGGGSDVVPVSGQVVFHSRDLPQVARLTFVPVEGSSSGGAIRPSGAKMEPDGTYRVTPYQGVEGLLPGTYKVRVSYYDLKPGGNPDREADWAEYTHEAGELVVEPGSGAIEHDVEVP
jgi:hypothetical protein